MLWGLRVGHRNHELVLTDPAVFLLDRALKGLQTNIIMTQAKTAHPPLLHRFSISRSQSYLDHSTLLCFAYSFVNYMRNIGP